MKVLSISSDRKIFDPRSATALRQIAYGKGFGTLDIIVFSRKSQELAPTALSSHVHAYLTASRSRLFYVTDALRLARGMTRPDVVTVQDPFEAGIAGLLIARHFKIPLHVQVHTDFLSPEFAKLSLPNRARVWIAGFVLRRASRIRVVSERIRKTVQEKYHLRAEISVLPIFVDIESARRIRSDPAPVRVFSRFDNKLLFVGRLEPEKNPRLAIRAFAEVAPERACLIIVGDGSEQNMLKEFAKKLGLMEGSRMVFFEENIESAKYYPPVDLVLVTSRYEGYGLVIIEALAAGKPVLATDVGIAREAGAIVTTEEQFAEALRAWFKNGPRTGELKDYPYRDSSDYIQAYCEDIRAVAK